MLYFSIGFFFLKGKQHNIWIYSTKKGIQGGCPWTGYKVYS